jgi:hypothetical protein
MNNNDNIQSNDNIQTNDDKMIIGSAKIRQDIIGNLGPIGLTIYYTYSYFETEQQYRNNVLFNCLLILIIIGWINILYIIEYVSNVIKFYNLSINIFVLDILLIRKNFIYRFSYILYFIGLGTCLYIMKRFIPFTDCSAYPELHGYQNACISMKIIGFMTIIYFCSTCLCLLCFTLCKCTSKKMKIHMDRAKALINMTIPMKLFFSEPSCDICIRPFLLNEQIVSVNNCGHKFHNDCFNEWTKYQIDCPRCPTILIKKP